MKRKLQILKETQENYEQFCENGPLVIVFLFYHLKIGILNKNIPK